MMSLQRTEEKRTTRKASAIILDALRVTVLKEEEAQKGKYKLLTRKET